MPNAVRELFSHHGGPARVAEVLTGMTGKAVARSTVYGWCSQGYVPSWWLAPVRQMAANAGAPLDDSAALALVVGHQDGPALGAGGERDACITDVPDGRGKKSKSNRTLTSVASDAHAGILSSREAA